MIALLLFSYACCALGVWFGWYLRGRRSVKPVPIIVYGDSFVHDSPRARQLKIANTALLVTGQDSTE